MDIFKRAEAMDADYFDPATGCIYKIQEYNRAKRLFGIDLGIAVVDSMTGECVGRIFKEEKRA